MAFPDKHGQDKGDGQKRAQNRQHTQDTYPVAKQQINP